MPDQNQEPQENSEITDYGDDIKPQVIEPEQPTKQGHSGRNILSTSSPATPQEQKEHVSKSKSIPKKEGRVTRVENELKKQRNVIKELNTNITKMMFVIVVLSVCLAAYKLGALVHVDVNAENVIEFVIALLLSYFGLNSTYKYTKEHPEAGETKKQIVDTSKEFVEDFTKFFVFKKKD